MCSYLPNEFASLEIRAIVEMDPSDHGDLLTRGYRRFGWQVFRPACEACRECRSMRVLVQQFVPSESHRRVLRKNADVRAELHPLFVTPEHVRIYNLYQRFMRGHRGWELYQKTQESYYEQFILGSSHLGRQWLYRENGKLVGVALMDEAPGAISLVYCFYDPAWRPRSPGTFSILKQLAYAKERGLDYAYLGYWVEGCQSLKYKSQFRPHEILQSYPADDAPPVWR
jgi:arginine-tRNA-protein transferase